MDTSPNNVTSFLCMHARGKNKNVDVLTTERSITRLKPLSGWRPLSELTVGIDHPDGTAVRIETPVRMELSTQMIKNNKLP